jgi:2-furoyl-CoA dehydrogenase FAD binding subunit
MKPPKFDYIRVETLEEALAVLADGDLEAKVLAGGQSLLPLLNMRLARPKALLDITRLAALAKIEQVETDLRGLASKSSTTTYLEVGAVVRQRQLERYVGEEPRARLIQTALSYVGHPQTRNQGTVGGSLAHADPSAELPLLFLTLRGATLLQSTRGERKVAAEEFFQTSFTTVIQPDELLTKTWWRLPEPDEGIAFKEYRRRHGDFALLAAACTMKLGDGRIVQQVQLGLGGIADTPLLIGEVGELIGQQWSKERVRKVTDAVVHRLHFTDDYLASSSYRRQLASVLIASVLEDAYANALGKVDPYGMD